MIEFMGFIWNQSWVFIFIPIIFVLFFFYLRNQKNKASFQVSRIAQFKEVKTSLKLYFLKLNEIVLLISLIMFILALARPQTRDEKIRRTQDGIDIVVVLDISDSMLIEDMIPENRLEAAKDTIKKFIAKRTSDRIGVVIFAGEAFTLVPLTLDYQMIIDRTAQIKTARDARVKDGTAIGVAIAAGAARLKDSQAKSRVMIFLTDGENNSGTIDPETGLEIAKGYGLKIYSIGLGKSGPTKLPITTEDVFGNKVKHYQPFESTVNDELLEKMASDTGGRYFRATKEDSLGGVFDEINKLETTKIENQKFVRYNEYFYYFLSLGLLLFSLNRILSMTWLKRGP